MRARCRRRPRRARPENLRHLLACADLMLGAELAEELGVPLTENLDYWTEHLAADRLPEVEDAEPNWRACLLLVDLTAPIGGAEAAGPDILDIHKARTELALTGLGLLVPGEIGPHTWGHVLAVPNKSPLVGRLFEGTPWAGAPGAGGPWKDALRQAPDSIVISDKNKNRVTIGGVQMRCSLVVLKHFHEAPER
jgi:hypothetical protein